MKKIILPIIFAVIVCFFLGCTVGDETSGTSSTPTNNPTSTVTPTSTPTTSPTDTPIIEFISESSSGMDNWDETWSAQVQLDRPTSQVVYFDYYVGGSATQGVDYELLSEKRLAITPGQDVRSAWIQWRVFADSAISGNKTITFTIFKAENAKVGPKKVFTHTILPGPVNP